MKGWFISIQLGWRKHCKESPISSPKRWQGSEQMQWQEGWNRRGRLSLRDVSEVVSSRFDRQIGDSRKGGLSNLRLSQPKRRLRIVRLGQGSGSHCSYGIKTLSILCHERLFCLFGWVCVCVLESLQILAVLEGVGQGTNLWEGKGTKNTGRVNLSNTNSRYTTFPLEK